MILSEKISKLRRQKGWSQEDLAEQLNISRQSVSKWESSASIPDLDKIIAMSEIFGVSTDYLLKDELEEITCTEAPVPAEEEKTRGISLDEANAYLEAVRKRAPRISLAIFLLVCSPICLLLMGGAAEYGKTNLTENMAGGFGVAILLILVAIGVTILILNGMPEYEFLKKEAISLEYGVQGIVEMKKKNFAPVYHKYIASGVALFILGVVPLFLAAALSENELLLVSCVGLLLFFVACGAALCTWAGSIWESYNALLQQEDYSLRNKAIQKRIAFFPGVYWCLVTAVYLGISFSDKLRIASGTENIWNRSWIIWPVAGVLYAALYNLLRAAAASRTAKQ